MVLLAFPELGWAEEWRGRVVHVADGDTLVVMHEGRRERIRLAWVDCPERRQPFGEEAKAFTTRLVEGRTVLVRVWERDRYGRLVARVTAPGRIELGDALVQAGLAWHYKQYSKDAWLARMERKARRQKVGLWADPDPEPPWAWRRHHRRPAGGEEGEEP